MAYLALNNFKYGLDTRRSELSSLPGTLLALNNGHINEGGECEKRKEFGLIESLPHGTGYTFGMLPTATSILVFGSASSGTVGELTSPLVYQQLQHPDGATAMTSVVSTTLFGNESFVVAGFADGNSFAYYNGALIPDFYAGLVASWQNTDNQIASAIATLVNDTAIATNPVTGELVYTATATNNIVEVFSTPSTSSGQPFTNAITLDLEPTSTGLITSDPVTSGSASTAAVQAVGSFEIIAGTAASGFASGTIAINNINTGSPGPTGIGDAFYVGSQLYTLCTPAYLAAHSNFGGYISVGTTTATCATNIAACINGTGTPGTQYGIGTPANTSASAAPSGSTVDLTALTSGVSGNSVVIAYFVDNHSSLTFSGATLSGGTNSDYFSSVNVNGNNLLSAQIPWDQNPSQTAIDIVVNINANSASNGGFTAASSGGTVTIFSPIANAANYNSQAVSVVVVGQIIIQQMAFNITACTTSTTITGITVGGVTITSGTITSSSSNTFTFAGQIATNINGAQATYVALAVQVSATVASVYISPFNSTSASTPGTVIVTSGGSGGAFVATGAGALTVPLVSYSIAGATAYRQMSSSNPRLNETSNFTQYLTSSDAAMPTGGTPPYSYKWTYAGSSSTQLVCQYPTEQTTGWFYTRAGQINTANNSEQWICTVTDSATPTPNIESSQPVTIFF